MYEFIVFDLDGTILDTIDDLAISANAVLEKNGAETHSLEKIKSFVGNGIRKLIERSLGEKYAGLLDTAFADFVVYYNEHCNDNTKPYAGIVELLIQLKERGIKSAVLSNKADTPTKKLCKEHFDDLIVEAVGEREKEGIRRKPDPNALFALMDKYGATKETTLFVGDSEVDLQTAENAGVDYVLVTWGLRSKEVLEKSGCRVFADTPKDILRLISEV